LIGLVALEQKPRKERLKYCYRNCNSNGFGIADDFFFIVWQNEAGNTKLPKVFPGMNLYQVIYAVLSF
jgi:hypothetical protein